LQTVTIETIEINLGIETIELLKDAILRETEYLKIGTIIDQEISGQLKIGTPETAVNLKFEISQMIGTIIGK
jgi:hypothetical protein